jgi:hypothetical protein
MKRFKFIEKAVTSQGKILNFIAILYGCCDGVISLFVPRLMP